MISAPKAPDPKETALAQSSMNRDTAITQQQLNMIDQITPFGTLTYQQTGSNFAPSDTGQSYWYNAATGEYRSDAPPVTGYNTVDVPGETKKDYGGDSMVYTTSGSTRQDPIYEEGWSQVKGVLTPKYQATTKLTPEQQAILDQTQGAGLNLATLANERSAFLKDYLGKEVDTSGIPALRGSIGGGFSGDIGGNFRTAYDPNYVTRLGSDFVTSYAGADDFSADRQRYEDAVRERMQPQLDQRRRSLETQLVGRGLRPGTAAWDSEMDRLARSEADADIAAILAGGDEQARMVNLARDAAVFGNQSILGRAGFTNDAIARRFADQNAASLAAAGFRNTSALQDAEFTNRARAQGLSEAYAARSQPINEIAALLSGAQVQQPNFVNTPSASVGGVDYAGLVSDKYKADVAAHQSAMGGLFGLLSAPFQMFSFSSDRRLKMAIRRIGALANGLGVYAYRYIWDFTGRPERIGVMADEVRKLIPKAVGTDSAGYDFVDYAQVLEAA